jgi:ribosome-associated toxin RatA of RatAB toxin-antitoxin module
VTQTVQTEHRTLIVAPAASVFRIVADVTRWPLFFHPTVHARVLERANDQETIRLWAFANDEVRTWTSRRRVDPHALRVEFRQTVCAPPVASMRGEWLLKPVDATSTMVVFGHEYRAVDDDPDSAAWIAEAVDRNSNAELAALKAAAQNHDRLDELVVSFEDTVFVDGSAHDVYEFLYQARQWPDRLPHVSRLDLREDDSGIQFMEMDTRAPDGSVHTTSSVRVCFPDEAIVYKQVRVPALMNAHTGTWTIRYEGNRVRLTAQHDVLLDDSAVGQVLGRQATLAQARAFVRTALGNNSRTTMERAKAYAEERRD